MGILDDAIKEHLELKRQHGAAEDELKQLEDEAFGAAERPGEEKSGGDALAEAPTEFMAQPDLEEAGEPEADVAQEATAPEAEEPAEEEAPAMEHEAIAEQPTEMYDVEGEEFGSSQVAAPSEEELVEEEIEEPRLAPVDPLAGLDERGEGDDRDSEEGEPEEGDGDSEDDEYEEDDDFWDEKRLSDELDQALEAPSEVEDEEALYEDAATEAEEQEETEPERPAPAEEQEDVLEETPDFLEEAPEDDKLWFEQKPPKDFDFDD